MSKAMKFVAKQVSNGKSITDALLMLLDKIGYYAFNRFAFKHGFQMNYVLALHKIKAKQNKKN